MKNTVLRIAIIVLDLAAAISCRKQEEHPAYERTARIASYYGGMAGEGIFKVLNACVDGKWEQWPPINGLDYEEGYEYEVRVRFDYNRELEGMTDVMFPYSGTLLELVKKTEGFSGAEIEEVVNEALFNAYANGQKDLEMQNLLDCISATSPLSRTMAETIANLRKWAEQRARMASKDKPDEVKPLGEDVPRLQQEYSNPFIRKKN